MALEEIQIQNQNPTDGENPPEVGAEIRAETNSSPNSNLNSNQTASQIARQSPNFNLNRNPHLPQSANQNPTIGANQNPEKAETKMVTIPQVKAENFLIGLEEALSDVQDLREITNNLIAAKTSELDNFRDETITKFNALLQSTTELKEKLNAAESYENYLEERVKNGNLTSNVSLLEKQLQKEKAEVSIFISTMTETIKDCTEKITSKIAELKSADEIIKDSIREFKEETEKISGDFASGAESKLNEICKTVLENSKNEYEVLKGQSSEMIKSYTEKCQSHLNTIKAQSIDFLKQCAKENEKLIKSVPGVKDKKLSKKDIIIYAMAVAAIASMVARLFVG